MKARFPSRRLSVSAGTRSRLEQSFEQSQDVIPVTAAAVVPEHTRDRAPAFRAFVLLAVRRPDIPTAACDQTLEAPWLKIITSLRRQIEQRKARKQSQVEEPGRFHRAVEKSGRCQRMRLRPPGAVHSKRIPL